MNTIPITEKAKEELHIVDVDGNVLFIKKEDGKWYDRNGEVDYSIVESYLQ